MRQVSVSIIVNQYCGGWSDICNSCLDVSRLKSVNIKILIIDHPGWANKLGKMQIPNFLQSSLLNAQMSAGG